MMAAKMLKKPKKVRDENSGFLAAMTRAYSKMLAWTMTKKGAISFTLFVLALFGSLFIVGPLLGSTFTPKTDEGLFEVTIEMPSGTNIEGTDKATYLAESLLRKTEGIKSWMSSIGGVSGSKDGKTISRITVQMLPRDQRHINTIDVVNQLRSELTSIPDAKVSVILTTSMAGDPNASDLDVEITGSDFADILQTSNKLVAFIEKSNMVADVRSTWKSGKPERVYQPNRAALADYGLTVAQVGQAIRTYVYGQEVSVYREKNDEYDILVRYQESDRDQASDILSATILSPIAGYIPLSAVVEEKLAEGPSTIERKDKERLVYIKNYLLPGIASSQLQAKIIEWFKENPSNADTKIGFGGNSERMAEAVIDFGVAIIMAILLTYILLTALLESFSQPLIIMSTLPLGLIGVIWSLFLTGKDISIIALMAVVMLIGIVVNNAILILDDANHLVRNKGEHPDKAVFESAVSKFRAILMTNMATVLAMVPLALGIGEGAEFRQPMAITAIGGLIVSTVLTVFLIPIMYKALGKFMNRKKRNSAH